MEEPAITKAQSVFSMSCRVEVNVRAEAQGVWRLLTDAKGFPSWNSTVSRIEGQISEGQRLRVHVPGTNRTFTPTVSDIVPNERMTWTGGFAPMFKGVRSLRAEIAERRVDRFCNGGAVLGADAAAGEGLDARLRCSVRDVRQ